MFKYPRTPHIVGSRFQLDDHDLEAVRWTELVGKHLIIEEKMDGANTGISFTQNGELQLQSRGHYLRGGPREKQFDLLKQWATTHQETFFSVLGSRYVMYGEWMFAKHTYFYDDLPHYFLEFDILDTQNNVFLSTKARRRLLFEGPVVAPITQVAVLHQGIVLSMIQLQNFLKRSGFITHQRFDNLVDVALMSGQVPADVMRHSDLNDKMEGLYIKWEDEQHVLGRYKFVRDTFLSNISNQDQHWHDRPIIQNQLRACCFEKMFM